MANKDVKKLIRRVEKEGWRVDHDRKHYLCFPPNGEKHVVISKTPSGQVWRKKAISNLRKKGFRGD